MTPSILFICGGAWSGKSRRAQELALTAPEVVWVGTASSSIPKIQAQVSTLKASRPKHWITIDSPLNLPSNLVEIHKKNPPSLVVIDSISQWISNEVAKHSTRYDQEQLEEKLRLDVDDLCTIIKEIATSQSLILVSSDFGQSIPPADPLGRTMRMLVGQANQEVASLVNKIEIMMAGVVVLEKQRN